LDTALVIIFVGLLVFLAHFFVILFERTRVPDVLYLILIGVLIGPVLQIISPEDFGKIGHIFTTIALVVILFEGGLSLDLDVLRESLKGSVSITILSYVVSMILLTAGFFILTPFGMNESVFAGAVLAGPAPSVIIPLARQLNLKESTRTILTLESPLGEALCILVSLAILESFKLSEIQIGHMIGRLLSSFLFALIIGVMGGFFWSILLHKMRQLRNAIFTTPSFVFILYGVAEFLGFSGPVAALTFGITLGNIDIFHISWVRKRFSLKPLHHDETEKLFFGEIVFVVKTFFFVYLGISVYFADLKSMAIALLLTVILLLSRLTAVRFGADSSVTPRGDASLMSVLIPKGTAAAVLAALPIQMGIVGGEFIQDLIYEVILTSILLTALLIYLAEKTSFSGILWWFFEGFSMDLKPQAVEAGTKKKSAKTK